MKFLTSFFSPIVVYFFLFLKTLNPIKKKTNTTNHSFLNILRETYCILFVCDYNKKKIERSEKFTTSRNNNLEIHPILIKHFDWSRTWSN